VGPIRRLAPSLQRSLSEAHRCHHATALRLSCCFPLPVHARNTPATSDQTLTKTRRFGDDLSAACSYAASRDIDVKARRDLHLFRPLVDTAQEIFEMSQKVWGPRHTGQKQVASGSGALAVGAFWLFSDLGW
jgi:hypothetical protein